MQLNQLVLSSEGLGRVGVWSKILSSKNPSCACWGMEMIGDGDLCKLWRWLLLTEPMRFWVYDLMPTTRRSSALTWKLPCTLVDLGRSW